MRIKGYRNSYLENLFCFCEKWRIILKLGFSLSMDRKDLNLMKRPLRKYVYRLINARIILFHDCSLTALQRLERNLSLSEEGLQGDLSDRRLIVIHELSRTGAPKAALMLCQVLKNDCGMRISVISLQDGPMREEFESLDIDVILLEELSVYKDHFLSFIAHFHSIYVVSCSWDFLRILKYIDKPVAWWIHEIFTEDEQFSIINEVTGNVDLLLAGSPLVIDGFKAKVSPDKLVYLLYGLDPLNIPRPKNKKCLNFAIIGSVCQRKGQDIFIEAISLLPELIRQRARFTIIGDTDDCDSDLLKKLKDAQGSFNELEVLDSMPFNELIAAYSDFDVIVSASRSDPMPIVLTYAFMFKKLCLCPDSIGTARLVTDGENAVLFNGVDPQDLSSRIQDIIENAGLYSLIAERGTDIYD
jgi:glycosyltransferase involved in cell wall biosynthesis